MTNTVAEPSLDQTSLDPVTLDRLPLNRLTPPTWLDGPNGGQAAVLRQAIAFIEENAHRPIGIADIAAACHRGPRALQLAFRRGADTTPWAYVRAVRLARARQDLLAGDPRAETVFAVAHRWGFTNRSRFSAEYRAAYSEAPGATLRRPWAEPTAA